MDDYPIQGLLALSILLGPLFRLMFPLGFGRVCASRMLMRSGTVKPGPTPGEQAKIDRRLAEKKKGKEAKKKQKEEEAKRKLKERMDKELEEELKSIREEDEEEEQEEGETLQRRRHLDIPESSTASRLPVEPLDWAGQYYYSSEPLRESEEERDTFIAKLATVTDTVERNLMLEEKRVELNNKLLAARRQEVEEKKKLQAEGEKLQKALEDQKDKPSATEEQLALLREAVLNTRQDMALMRQTLQRVETHRVEFESVWNNFLEKSAKDVDQHVQTYIRALDEHVTKTFTPEVIEKIVKGAGGGGGDGDDDGDDDKKGKKVGDPKEKLPQEIGQASKIKLKLSWTYNGKKEESVLHWAAAIESYVYGQRIPYWDRVLMASSCMGGDAMSFTISLQKEAGCNSMVEFSQQTRIEDFLKAVRERFEDKNLARRTEMLILNLRDRKWKSTSALKATMDELLQCPDHGLTPAQILNSFARALPDPLRTQLYPRVKEEGMTYEKFGKIAVDHAGFLAEANYCHYWKDLQAGKKCQNCTISGSIPGKDSLLPTFEEGGANTIFWDQVDYGLDELSGPVAQEGSYAAVVARGGGRHGRGRGRGRGGRGRGGRGYGTQRGGGEGSHYVGGRRNGPSQGGRGDLVWVKSQEFAPEENISQKLLPAYRGPWQVLDVIGDVDYPSYVIEIPLHLHTYPVFHTSKLLPCVTNELFPSCRSAIPPSMDGKYDVDKIVAENTFHTGRRGRPQRQYKVRFAYQDPSEDRWFTREELLDSAPHIVSAYERGTRGIHIIDR
ncbi:hypothetical protein CBR_g74738 [Chara braunii]|uniref:Tf2-1-like SH3-like domain-containing protein n=1 Tax=Chara braunii TaxID=69332 RepID=A0A388JJF4_CHABU|nr:hypothetical protein CBR_g74738 [Chara braunii]|eukprot:GBG41651.1 hypothetical protein CBR_g74738 [Chara braunii]